MACSIPTALGVLTGLGFVDPPCVDTEPIFAIAGGGVNKVFNPITKRFVNVDSPLGKKLASCPSGKIYNPITDRYVKKNGKVGKELLK